MDPNANIMAYHHGAHALYYPTRQGGATRDAAGICVTSCPAALAGALAYVHYTDMLEALNDKRPPSEIVAMMLGSRIRHSATLHADGLKHIAFNATQTLLCCMATDERTLYFVETNKVRHMQALS